MTNEQFDKFYDWLSRYLIYISYKTPEIKNTVVRIDIKPLTNCIIFLSFSLIISSLMISLAIVMKY